MLQVLVVVPVRVDQPLVVLVVVCAAFAFLAEPVVAVPRRTT